MIHFYPLRLDRRESDATLAHRMGEGLGVRISREVSKSIPMKPDGLIAGLPGEDLVREGLGDIEAGRRTVPAFLAAIAHPRLRRAGVLRNLPPGLSVDVELQLYRLLRDSGGDAYSRYNALLRELISFENALDRRTGESRK